MAAAAAAVGPGESARPQWFDAAPASDAGEKMPSLSSGGAELYVPWDRPGGLRSYDLHVSTRFATAADRTEGARR